MKRFLIALIFLIGIWQPFDADGWAWNYIANDTLVASCSYTGMKINNCELWIMRFYAIKPDINNREYPIEEEAYSLYECVTRVNDFLIGGYYL